MPRVMKVLAIHLPREYKAGLEHVAKKRGVKPPGIVRGLLIQFLSDLAVKDPALDEILRTSSTLIDDEEE